MDQLGVFYLISRLCHVKAKDQASPRNDRADLTQRSTDTKASHDEWLIKKDISKNHLRDICFNIARRNTWVGGTK